MNTQPEAITQQRLHELFTYSDGVLLNKTIRRSQVKVGDPAGHQTKRGDKFQVHMKREGRSYYVGTFDDFYEAKDAAADARSRLFGVFA